ncbi:MAG: YraN family protein [Patescibacteria group bacterium]
MDSAVTGNTGEKLAVRFLKDRGFNIIETNYRKKWGEIDIIAEKNDILHFVEVKASVSPAFAKASSGKHEVNDFYRPEENIRLWKKQRMSRAIRTYLLDRKVPEEKEFLIDVIAMNLDFSNKIAKIRWVQNVIFE